MKIAILHGEVTPESGQDEQDVLVEVETVSRSLKNLGYEPVAVPISLDLKKAMTEIQAVQPDLAFNLVESIGGTGRFSHFAPSLLDYLNLPYTGARTNAIFVTMNKVLTKMQLQCAGILTPEWLTARAATMNDLAFEPPYFIKPTWEDASVGLDEMALVRDKRQVKSVLQEKIARYGDCFIEAFIDGREFNLSVLAGSNGPEVLPPAEIIFRNYPPGKPRIVDYRAKWESDSFEYQNTPRSFDFSGEDAILIQQLSEIALRCWHQVELRGYARVDFRVDARGCPLVLEINANPCISPDSGFVAACQQAGLTLDQVVNRIIQDALDNFWYLID